MIAALVQIYNAIIIFFIYLFVRFYILKTKIHHFKTATDTFGAPVAWWNQAKQAHTRPELSIIHQ